MKKQVRHAAFNPPKKWEKQLFFPAFLQENLFLNDHSVFA